MLTWMGLVGKLIDLIVNKVVGKKIDLALSDKKRAAKAFIRFYEATFRLEMILAAFLTYAELFIDREGSTKPPYRIMYEQTLKTKLGGLRGASHDFVESMSELGHVLYFFDKPLASLFARVEMMKRGMLKNVYYFFADSVSREVESEYNQGVSSEHRDIPTAKFRPTLEPANQFGNLSGIEFTMPSDALMELDFNEQFEQVFAYIKDESYWEQFYNHQDFVVTILESNIENGYIGATDKDKLIELYGKLKAHTEILTQAREKLRDFIQTQFTISDILSVSK